MANRLKMAGFNAPTTGWFYAPHDSAQADIRLDSHQSSGAGTVGLGYGRAVARRGVKGAIQDPNGNAARKPLRGTTQNVPRKDVQQKRGGPSLGAVSAIERWEATDRVRSFAFTDRAGDGAGVDVEQDGDIGPAQHGALLAGLLEEAEEFVLAGFVVQAALDGLVDIFGDDQVEDDGDESGILDGFALGAWVIGGDGGP